jgi:hypothetical protein
MRKMLILLVFVSVFAQETTHVVKEGDTLWDIAGWYYQDPFLWPYIWRANLTKIEDPHWIYPDQEFLIPPSPEGYVEPGEAPVEEYYPEMTVPPAPPKKKEAEIISVITPDRRIFSEEMIHRAGFIIDEDLPHWGKITGTEPAGEERITSHKKVYIDRADEMNLGEVLTIYRPGKDISHPKTGERLGKEIIVLGKAEVEAIGNEGSRCKVIASYDIIREGDMVIPYDPILAPDHVELIPTDKEVEGYIVEVKNPSKIMTQSQVFAYIDHGEETGIAVGDMFDVYEPRKVGGKEMPDFNIARIQVISTFRNVSIGLLLRDRETIQVKRGERIRLALEAR